MGILANAVSANVSKPYQVCVQSIILALRYNHSIEQGKAKVTWFGASVAGETAQNNLEQECEHTDDHSTELGLL